MSAATKLRERVAEYRPTPWFIANEWVNSGDERVVSVYSSNQNPNTDAPIMTADIDTCALVVMLVNSAERTRSQENS